MEDEAKVRNELLAMIIAEDDEEVIKKAIGFREKADSRARETSR